VTFDWEQFDHLPYSPDLAPSDFHVFLHLKTFLGGRQFRNDEVKEAVNMWFH
jgi:histone-lysine N-methyltransferase SETMAR